MSSDEALHYQGHLQTTGNYTASHPHRPFAPEIGIDCLRRITFQ